ncbi:MAG: AAA family ATPase, partial [Deltaproteobacteria bacterium]|nr:AAA family ATPase [Deltaproteobacteria bacterium]
MPALPSGMDKTPSLFAPTQPLAARLRPRSLKEFVGQEHLVGPGRLLRRALKAKRLFSSMIFWGPPGSGKTTLARALARVMDAQFASLS